MAERAKRRKGKKWSWELYFESKRKINRKQKHKNIKGRRKKGERHYYSYFLLFFLGGICIVATSWIAPLPFPFSPPACSRRPCSHPRHVSYSSDGEYYSFLGVLLSPLLILDECIECSISQAVSALFRHWCSFVTLQRPPAAPNWKRNSILSQKGSKSGSRRKKRNEKERSNATPLASAPQTLQSRR